MDGQVECWRATVMADKYSVADAQQSTLRCRTYVLPEQCGGAIGLVIDCWMGYNLY